MNVTATDKTRDEMAIEEICKKLGGNYSYGDNMAKKAIQWRDGNPGPHVKAIIRALQKLSTNQSVLVRALAQEALDEYTKATGVKL